MKHHRFLLTTFLIFVTAFGVWAQTASPIIGGTEEQVRALLERWAIGAGDTTNPQITVGAAPSNLPITISLPENTPLLAGISRENVDGRGMKSYELLFNSDANPQDLLDFFNSQFADWELVNSNVSNGGGFNAWRNVNAQYCSADAAYSLSFDGYGNTTSPMQFTLRVSEPGEPYLCNQGDNPEVYFDPIAKLVPSFTPVTGVDVLPQYSGTMAMTPDDAASFASMNLSIAIEDAFNAYNQQLVAANWQAVSSIVGENMVVSQWTITAEDGSTWYGTFTIFPTGSHYKALINVSKQI